MMSRGDDVLDNVSMPRQYIPKRIIVDGVETPKSNKIALWVQVARAATALAVLHSQTI